MSPDRKLLELLSPEARLVLHTAGGPERDSDIAALLGRPLDWPLVAWLVSSEAASSIVWRRISRVAPAAVPAEAADTLRRLALMADFRTTYLWSSLERILEALSRQGVPVALLKGAALRYLAYADVRDRPMGDLDLLVPASHAEDAWHAAVANGWVWQQDLYPWSRYDAHHHLPPLTDRQGVGARLEVHTRLCAEGSPYSLDFDAVRAVARPLPELGDHVVVLPEDHQILHLAVHFAWSHEARVGGWRCFRDIAALAATGRVDWDRVAALAVTHRVSGCCYWTLRLANRLAGVDVPTHVLHALAPRTPRLLRPMIERHLATQVLVSDRVCPSQQMRRLLWSMAMVPHGWDRQAPLPWETEPARTAPGDAVGRRMSRHLGSASQWLRYLRLVALAR